MVINDFDLLESEDKMLIHGTGSDKYGIWELNGEINSANQVNITKHYLSPDDYNIQYQGQYDGQKIVGTWSNGTESDKFKFKKVQED